MTAKEKADTLYWKYYQLVADCSHPEEKAKECALIAVDEIINSRPLEPNHADWDDCGATHKYWYDAQKEEALKYWQEVRKEILSL